jgi:GNAT superfamily N-acetyltransferase
VTWRVRAFADRDYPAFVRIKSLAEQRAIDVAAARDEDRRWDHQRYERVRVVAVDEEDAPLGYGEIYHEPSRFEPRRYFVRLAVEPRLRRRGIGAALWRQLQAELEERAALVACLWVDDGTACHDFVQARGFVEVIRAYAQVLALATARIPLDAAEARVGPSGIRVTTLSELRAERADAALRDAYELHTAARLDQPTLGHVTAPPYDEWLAFNVEAPEALPDAYLLAVDADRLVGCASVRATSADQLHVGITAVLPGYRRRGIGRLLKLRLHDWARRGGYREIHTSNTRPNVGMLALNESLGYVIVGSWGGYELRFAATR